MRLGTKILLLTLAIALGLAGAIVWVVSASVARRERERTEAGINEAVSNYFGHIGERHAAVDGLVRLLMEGPENRALLEQVDAGNAGTDDPAAVESAEFARAQLRDEIFGRIVATELGEHYGVAPAFHVLLDAGGKLLVTSAEDEKLAGALAAEQVEWPYQSFVDVTGRHVRRYLWVAGGLYLAMGVPLKLDIEEGALPTHVYFAGFRVNDEWTRLLLGRVTAGGDEAATTAPSESPRTVGGGLPLRAWFVVDGKPVAAAASGASSTMSAPVNVDSVWSATWAGESDSHGGRRRIAFDASGESFAGEAITFSPAPGKRGALAVASSVTEALKPLRQLQRTIGFVTAVAVVVAIIAFRIVSELIARPVRTLVDGTRRVARGEFDAPIELRGRRDEFGELAAGFNEMSAGLRQREFIKNTFGKFVDPKVVEMFLADESRAMLGGERRVQSVLFSDLANFTRISEKLAPEDLIRLLNGYLGDAAEVVRDLRGIVDKFIGDAVVAFWGPPVTDDHAVRACRAAVQFLRSMPRHAAACEALGVPPLSVRVGIATGEVVVGNMGSEDRKDYTVIGDTANLGSRLEGLNKVYKTRVLVCPRTAEGARDAVVLRRIDRARVVGRAEPVELFEVLAERDGGDANEALRLCEQYESALALYESRQWRVALEAFSTLAADPGDAVSGVMAARCATFFERGPAADWDGVWNVDSK